MERQRQKACIETWLYIQAFIHRVMVWWLWYGVLFNVCCDCTKQKKKSTTVRVAAVSATTSMVGKAITVINIYIYIFMLVSCDFSMCHTTEPNAPLQVIPLSHSHSFSLPLPLCECVLFCSLLWFCGRWASVYHFPLALTTSFCTYFFQFYIVVVVLTDVFVVGRFFFSTVCT